MTDVEFTVEGLAQVVNALGRLGKTDVDNTLRATRLEAGNTVRAAALAMVPNSSGRSSGRLASAHLPPQVTRYGVVVSVSRRAAPYAGVIHFGWDRQRRFGKARGGPVEAQPWLHNAGVSTEARWMQQMANGVQELLDEIAAR